MIRRKETRDEEDDLEMEMKREGRRRWIRFFCVTPFFYWSEKTPLTINEYFLYIKN